MGDFAASRDVVLVVEDDSDIAELLNALPERRRL